MSMMRKTKTAEFSPVNTVCFTVYLSAEKALNLMLMSKFIDMDPLIIEEFSHKSRSNPFDPRVDLSVPMALLTHSPHSNVKIIHGIEDIYSRKGGGLLTIGLRQTAPGYAGATGYYLYAAVGGSRRMVDRASAKSHLDLVNCFMDLPSIVEKWINTAPKTRKNAAYYTIQSRRYNLDLNTYAPAGPLADVPGTSEIRRISHDSNNNVTISLGNHIDSDITVEVNEAVKRTDYRGRTLAKQVTRTLCVDAYVLYKKGPGAITAQDADTPVWRGLNPAQVIDAASGIDLLLRDSFELSKPSTWYRNISGPAEP